MVDACSGNKFSEAEAATFKHTTHIFLTQYCEIARLAMAAEFELFALTIKFHYLMHCALQAKYFSLKKSWCYSGEDFMKHSKRLMAACTRGVKPQNVPLKFAEKYPVALHLLFKKIEEAS